MSRFTEIAFTPAVKKVQSVMGTRTAMQKLSKRQNKQDALTDELMDFVRERSSAFIATSSAVGQPYIQHRGGKPGFLRVVNSTTLMMSDEPGNGQFITQGNLSENPGAMLFLMDYAKCRRVKIWGEAFVSFDPNLGTMLNGPGDTEPFPVIVFRIKAWDENCPKNIPRLFGEDVIASLEARIQDLEMGLAVNG